MENSRIITTVATTSRDLKNIRHASFILSKQNLLALLFLIASSFWFIFKIMKYKKIVITNGINQLWYH